MAEEKKKGRRGGKRPGAGRPKTMNNSKMFTFRAGDDVAEILDKVEHRSEFIKDSVRCYVEKIKNEQPTEGSVNLKGLGNLIPATNLVHRTLPYFDLEMVAGFPIPLDNDERAQQVDVIKMLCPNPEACYIINVKGRSMIDAGLQDGDMVIIDKSERNPSEHQIGAFEWDGEYTLKYFKKDPEGGGWLIPANPDFPNMRVNAGDRLDCWGVVTYIIHRPN